MLTVNDEMEDNSSRLFGKIPPPPPPPAPRREETKVPQRKKPSFNASSQHNPKFKVTLCKDFTEKGSCPMGEGCNFAHGENELRGMTKGGLRKDVVYKTVLCEAFAQGKCRWGATCRFAHGEEELREVKPIPVEEQYLTDLLRLVNDFKAEVSELRRDNCQLHDEAIQNAYHVKDLKLQKEALTARIANLTGGFVGARRAPPRTIRPSYNSYSSRSAIGMERGRVNGLVRPTGVGKLSLRQEYASRRPY